MNKKKLLFILPPYLPFDEYHPKKIGQKLPILSPPYGVLSLISYINKDKKYDCKITDLNEFIIHKSEQNNYQEFILNEIKKNIYYSKPNYICISALSNNAFDHIITISKECKKISPTSTLLLGGGPATNLYDELFKKIPELDAICYGEGELPLYYMLENSVIPEKLHHISPAWITKTSLQQKIQPEHHFIQNIDEIPLIDFSYIDLEKYNGRSYIYKENDSERIEVSIHTTRGCPYNCSFCTNKKIHGQKIRYMSTERVIETIKYYKEIYKMKILFIEDDHFLSNKNRAIQILYAAKDLNVEIEFPNGLAVFQIDERIAKTFADCNIKVLILAIESGSDYVLKNLINKPLRKEKIKYVVSILKKYDFKLHAFIVIGFPYEEDQHREESLNFLINLGLDWFHIFIVAPIAGSRLYEQCREKGFLLINNHVINLAQCNISAPGVIPEKINEYAYIMNIILNYMENNNLKTGNFDRCKDYFKNVINHYPHQAIAHYALYATYQKTNEKILMNYHYTKFFDIYFNNEYYKKIVKTLQKKGYVFDGL